MKRTISIQILATPEQNSILLEFQSLFASVCNEVVPFAVNNKCFNRVSLHHLSYYTVRFNNPTIGSQMVCNAIKSVATSYKSLFSNLPRKAKKEEWKEINFKESGSIHYDKKTYTLKDNNL